MKTRQLLRLAATKPSRFFSRLLRSRLVSRLEDWRLRLVEPQPGVVSRIHLCVLGMRRSGNHAVIEWLLDRGRAEFGRAVFLNNLPAGVNGFRHRVWYPEELSQDSVSLYQQCRVRRFPPEGLGLLLRSYEDIDPDRFVVKRWNRFYYGGAEREVTVVVLRDPLNLFASRIKAGYVGTRGKDQLSLYLDMVAYAEGTDGVIEIDFNRFIGTPTYRRSILDAIGFAESGDLNLRGLASPYGGGSSFGDAAPSSEDLSHRFLHMMGHPEFERLRADPRIEEIVRRRYSELYDLAYARG